MPKCSQALFLVGIGNEENLVPNWKEQDIIRLCDIGTTFNLGQETKSPNN